MKAACLFICSFIFLVGVQGQSLSREQLTGTWIGVRLDYDDQFSRPYPVCLRLGTDSTYAFRLIDEKSPVHRSTWNISTDKLRLDTNVYKPGQWTLDGNELRLTGAYLTVFRRFTDIPVDSLATYQTVTGYKWISDSLIYHFHTNGSACIENPKTGDLSVHCWRLAQIEKSLFLVIKGKLDDCNGNFQYPLQISQISSGQLTCLGGSNLTINQLKLRRGTALQTSQPCQPKGFQPCTYYRFPSFALYPYFTYRRGRLYDIRQVVEREYKPVNIVGQSGLVRFKFLVNCRGEAGQFDMLTVNDTYQKCTFDARITDQLLTICQTKLTGWEAGQTNDDHTLVDTFCLLTFRLKDGLITDIFP